MPKLTVFSCVHALALAVLVSGADAQSSRVVRVSAAQYAAASMLTLDTVAVWCRNPDTPGCDVRQFLHAQVLPDGGIVASDFSPPVRRFAKDGRFMHDVTRSGSGPGELRNVMAMRYAGGDSVWLYANIELRLVQSALSGKGGTSATAMPPLTVMDMGFLGAQPVAWSMGRVAKAGQVATGALFTMPSDTLQRRVIFTFELPSIHEVGSGEFTLEQPPFTSMPRMATGAAGDAAYTSAGRYEVHVVPATDQRWHIVVDVSPRPVTTKELDSVAVVLTERAKRGRGDPRIKGPTAYDQDRLRRAPKSHAVVTELVLLRDGTLMVRAKPAANANRVRWDAYTKAGVLLGQLQLPLQANILDGDRNQLLIGQVDSDGIPYIALFRLRTPKPNETR